jgi:hypothetical protein
MTKSFFLQRALHKAGEHFRSDRSGWSLLGYSFKWLFSRTKRKIATRLTGRAPERFCDAAPDTIMMAVKVTGGLGDYVVFARVLRDLNLLSGDLRLHIFCSSVASGEWVFGCLPCVDGVYDDSFLADVNDQYDCVMHLNQLVSFDAEPLNLGKLRRLSRPLSQCLASWRRSRKQWELYRERQPTMNGAFAHHAVVLGHNRYSFLHSQLGLVPGGLLLDLPCDDSVSRDLARRFGSWLTINNGFDANFVISSQQATKCYPAEHWQTVVAGLKHCCPSVKIVQIGGRTSVPIPGVDLNLVNATSLSQAAALLKDAVVHVDVEGGLVHVAASLGTRSVVLFGPTSVGYFGYPDNINLTSGFCGNCWGVTERWMETCPRGYNSARCMDLLDPARVLDAVANAVHKAMLRQAA